MWCVGNIFVNSVMCQRLEIWLFVLLGQAQMWIYQLYISSVWGLTNWHIHTVKSIYVKVGKSGRERENSLSKDLLSTCVTGLVADMETRCSLLAVNIFLSYWLVDGYIPFCEVPAKLLRYVVLLDFQFVDRDHIWAGKRVVNTHAIVALCHVLVLFARLWMDTDTIH